jgi:hypothetical protein
MEIGFLVKMKLLVIFFMLFLIFYCFLLVKIHKLNLLGTPKIIILIFPKKNENYCYYSYKL